MAEYYRDYLLTAHPLGAPGRPNARVRRRLNPSASPSFSHKPTIPSSHPNPYQTRHTPQHKLTHRRLTYSHTHKTKTQHLFSLLHPSIRQDPLLDILSRLHWILDDEGNFRDYAYFEDFGDSEESRWWEMEIVEGEVEGVVDVEGRRFSLESELEEVDLGRGDEVGEMGFGDEADIKDEINK